MGDQQHIWWIQQPQVFSSSTLIRQLHLNQQCWVKINGCELEVEHKYGCKRKKQQSNGCYTQAKDRKKRCSKKNWGYWPTNIALPNGAPMKKRNHDVMWSVPTKIIPIRPLYACFTNWDGSLEESSFLKPWMSPIRSLSHLICKYIYIILAYGW